MIFYSIVLKNGDLITTSIDTLEEAIELIQDDLGKWDFIKALEFKNDSEEVILYEEDVENLSFQNWDQFCADKYGVPRIFLNISNPSIQKDYANWKRQKAEKEEKLQSFIKEKIAHLF